jgi:GH24 family phage-related lysozyme (muramidase)
MRPVAIKSDERPYQIYCDMDGVLVDFDQAFKKLMDGKLWNDAVEAYGLEELWRRINSGGPRWWAELHWAKDGEQLWDFIKDKGTIILTAGTTSMTGKRADEGKREWCRKHLGPAVEVIVTDRGTDKKYWAAPNHILIDDLEENIRAWRTRGGIGIHHRDTPQTIAQLKEHILSFSPDEQLEEDWRSLATAGLLGLSTLKGMAAHKHVIPHAVKSTKSTVTHTIKPMDASSPEQVLMSYENSKDNPKGGYDRVKGRWFPHKSIEGGSDTIAYGHKIQAGEDFSAGITDEQAVTLLRQDIARREVAIRKALPTYDDLPQYVKNAIVSAWYRGDLGPKATPKTMALMKAGDWSQAASEYLNSQDYKTGFTGVKKRMQDNAAAFSKFASEKV